MSTQLSDESQVNYGVNNHPNYESQVNYGVSNNPNYHNRRSSLQQSGRGPRTRRAPSEDCVAEEFPGREGLRQERGQVVWERIWRWKTSQRNNGWENWLLCQFSLSLLQPRRLNCAGICSKICSITHWPNFNLNHIRMQLPLLGILSLSGYFFVKDKTDIRDQNLLIVKSIL